MRKLMVAVMLTAFSVSANAIPVTWTFDNAAFDDGGTITGSFTFDADTNLYSDVSITTSANSFSQEHVYSTLLGDGNNAASGGNIASPAYYRGSFDINFSSSLTNAGGLVALATTTREGCDSGTSFGGADCNQFGDARWSRTLVSGTVSTVPVPAAVWLFGSALGGLGWMRRRKTL